MKHCVFLLILIKLALGQVQVQTVTLLGNVKITFTYTPYRTHFLITTRLANKVSVNNAWIGIGFNNIKSMDNASVVVCTNILGDTSVKHNLNTNINYRYSVLLDPSRPSLGISNFNLVTSEGTLTCSFTRDNLNENPAYYKLYNGASPYILVAYGSGQIGYHGINKCITSTPYTFQLSSNNANIYKFSNFFYVYYIIHVLNKVF